MASVFELRGSIVVGVDDVRTRAWVLGGRLTFERPSSPGGDVTVLEGWALPGLVDAHSHVGLEQHGAVDQATQQAQAEAERDAGALLLRDAGSPADTRWIDDRADLPVIIRAGRHLARSKRYLRNYAYEIEPEELVGYVRQEARRGDGWVKLVGDWIDRQAGELAPCWPAEVLTEAIAAAHDEGARVTAHCFGADCLPDLLAAGIDCLEHATGLDEQTRAQAANQGTAIVPTLVNIATFPQLAAPAAEKYPRYQKQMLALHGRRYENVRAAHEQGVPVFCGTDAGGSLPHGLVAQEVAELRTAGLSDRAALDSACWAARRWLGRPGLVEGESADLVLYPDDPRDDVAVLGFAVRRDVARPGLRGGEMTGLGTLTGRAPVVPRSPGAAGLSALRTGGNQLRELLLVGFGSLGLAVAMTWPALRHPTRTVPQDLVDPLYFVWQIAWTGHALGAHPAAMYTTNAFTRAPGNLAYTDTVLGYAPFATVVNGLVPGTPGALLTYNLLFVLTAALAFFGGYLLARVLGARIPGALVLAAAFAYAPWHLAHARHLNVLSSGGIAIALALIAYGHGWTLRPVTAARPRRPVRPGWIVAGWLVGCWQLTLGFALGVPFAWTLFLVLTFSGLSWWRRGRPVVPRPVLLATAFGGVVFGLTGVLLTLPYQRVVNEFPVAKRTVGMVETYSPPVRGLLTAPPESWWWGSAQAGWRVGMDAIPEQTVLPGVVLLVLAAIGLRYSAWTPRHRLQLAVAVLVTTVLALGTSTPDGGGWTYLLLFRHLPGLSAVRTSGRLILWTTLALGLLAAGAVTKAADQLADRADRADRSDRLPERSGRRVRWRPALILLPALLVLAEGIGHVAQPVVPTAPVALRTLPGLVLVLPHLAAGRLSDHDLVHRRLARTGERRQRVRTADPVPAPADREGVPRPGLGGEAAVPGRPDRRPGPFPGGRHRLAGAGRRAGRPAPGAGRGGRRQGA